MSRCNGCNKCEPMTESQARSVPRRYLGSILALVLSAIFIVASGWQIEIITIWISQGIDHFEFPFFVGGSFPIYWARDVWYGIATIGWILGVWGGYRLGKD